MACGNISFMLNWFNMEISCQKNFNFLLKLKNVKVSLDLNEQVVEADGETVTIKGPGEYEVQSVSIAGIKIDEKIIYTFDLEEIRIAYLGDFQGKLTDAQIDWLDGVDVLVVSGQNADLIKQIGPSLAVSAGPIKDWSGSVRQEKKLMISKLTLPEEMEVVILNG